MTIETERLPSFPANTNPYHHDLISMGCDVTADVGDDFQSVPLTKIHAMFMNHDDNEVTLIYIPTGERIRIKFERVQQ